jgi:hypothetical protein
MASASPSRPADSALACGQALADKLAGARWVTVVDALRFGAPLAHMAAAMGLEADEVVAGLRSWVRGQTEHAGMSSAARDEAYALIEAAGR